MAPELMFVFWTFAYAQFLATEKEKGKREVLHSGIVLLRVYKQRDSRAVSPAQPPTESWMAPHHHLGLCVMRAALLQNISAFQGSLPHGPTPSSPPTTPALPRPPEGRPPPIRAWETGVLSPSRSTSTANLPGRWQPECDKSICPGLNLYANLK